MLQFASLVLSSFLLCVVFLLPVCCFGVSTGYVSPTNTQTLTLAHICFQHWHSIGPFHTRTKINGFNDYCCPIETGAVNSIWLAPNQETAYIASVNGGIWRTNSIHTYNAFGGPHWEPLTDDLDCMSMNSIHGSAVDPLTLVSACGFSTSGASKGSEPTGVYITTDGGEQWNKTAFPNGYWISNALVHVSFTNDSVNPSLVTRSSVIMVATYSAIYASAEVISFRDPYQSFWNIGGIFRSNDEGKSFTRVYQGNFGQIEAHPRNSSLYYASRVSLWGTASFTDKTDIYALELLLHSNDQGITWTPATNQPNITLACPGFKMIIFSRVTLGVNANNVTTIALAFYLVNYATGQDRMCMFYSADDGSTWSNIGAPASAATDINMRLYAGGKVAFMLDPSDPDILYVASMLTPVYRIILSTNEWTLISKGYDSTPLSDHATANSTQPHSDARHFVWDHSRNELLLANDGGIWRRTRPRDKPELGDWFSLSGDATLTEVFQMDVDPVSGTILAATQDNAVLVSQFDGSEATSGSWGFLPFGDGLSVAVDHQTQPVQIYAAGQHIGNYMKYVLNHGGTKSFEFFQPPIQGCSPGDPRCFGFVTKIAVNSVNNHHILLCTASNTQGGDGSKCFITSYVPKQSVIELEFDTLSPQLQLPHLWGYAFGGMKNGVKNEHVIFAVGRGYMWARDQPCANASCISVYSSDHTCTLPACNMHNAVNKDVPFQTDLSIFSVVTQHPYDYYINVVVDYFGHTFLTFDFGGSWIHLNLPSVSNLLSVSGHTSQDTVQTGAVSFLCTNNTNIYEEFTNNGSCALLIGTPRGLFITFSPLNSSYFVFHRFGANLPRVILTHLVYQPQNDTLYVSTFGRGIWAIYAVSRVVSLARDGHDTTIVDERCRVPLYPNLPQAYGYNSSNNEPPQPIGFVINIDCEYTTSFSACNSSCGVAYRRVNYLITTAAAGSGTPCPSNTSELCTGLPICDTTAPVISGATFKSVEATSSAGATVAFTVTSTDDVDGSVVVTCTPASNTMFALGNTSVTCSSTDKAGNKATTSFIVNVKDTTAPVIAAVANVTLSTSSTSVSYSYPLPSVIDVVSPKLVATCSPASPATLPLGVTIISCSAGDAAGNVAYSAWKVTVIQTGSQCKLTTLYDGLSAGNCSISSKSGNNAKSMPSGSSCTFGVLANIRFTPNTNGWGHTPTLTCNNGVIIPSSPPVLYRYQCVLPSAYPTGIDSSATASSTDASSCGKLVNRILAFGSSCSVKISSGYTCTDATYKCNLNQVAAGTTGLTAPLITKTSKKTVQPLPNFSRRR